MGAGVSGRDHVVSLRLTAAQRARLEMLTEVHGVDQSTVIRELIDGAPLWSMRWSHPEGVAFDGDLADLLRRRIAGSS